MINTKEIIGSFLQGGTYKDRVDIYDSEVNEMTDPVSDFENNITLKYGKYNSGSGSLYCGYEQPVTIPVRVSCRFDFSKTGSMIC
jgi:hypothetical protein